MKDDVKCEISKEVLCVLERIMCTPAVEIELHFREALNGKYFRFDAIKMAYFILEMRKLFGIRLSYEELRVCSYWSPQRFVDFNAQQSENRRA